MARETTPEPRGRKRAAKPSKWGFGTDALEHDINLFEVDGELLRDAIARVALEGDALSISLTSDQGAVCVCIMSEGGKEKAYPPTTEALEGVLRHIRDMNA